jgi:uncharacterized membrane protein HdeD (DUF308 family)
MRIRLFKNWWMMTLKGLLSISYGLIVVIRHYPLIKSSMAVSFGLILVGSGLMIIVGAFMHKSANPRWKWWLIEGAIDIVIGTVYVFKPDLAKAFFLFFLAIWAFAIGVIQIITSLRMINYMDRWWLMMLAGIFSLLFAILVFINPFYANFDLSLIIGFSCVVFGVIQVINSRILRNIYL